VVRDASFPRLPIEIAGTAYPTVGNIVACEGWRKDYLLLQNQAAATAVCTLFLHPAHSSAR
jgi:hypothetical protein